MKRSARSTRFPVALHIMCLLERVEVTDAATCLSSGLMAQSVNKNEVLIRQMLSMLSKAGLVKSTSGSKGGARLAKDAKTITLLDIYKAVESERIFGVHEGSDSCPVARFVEDYLGAFLQEAEDKFEKDLSELLLSDIGAQLHAKAMRANFKPPPFHEHAPARTASS